MPTRLIDSAPPPITSSCWPLITCAAAKFTASRPEAQKRLICTPGTASPRPAFSAAKRAMSRAGLADRIDHAEHDVVDDVFAQIVAVLERLQRHGGERQRRDLVQRAVRLAAAARGADVIVDIGLGHDALLI